MKDLSSRLLVSLLLTKGLALATPQQNYQTLTTEVHSYTLKGTAGSVALQSKQSFPLIISPKREVIAAASSLGEGAEAGRMVALAHNGMLNPLAEQDKQWTKNIVTWTAHSSDPSILLCGISEKDWKTKGYKASAAPQTWNAKTLDGINLLIINANNPGFIAHESDLVHFLQTGGGIILLSTPWAASKEAQAASKHILESAGLAFLNSGPSDATFEIPTKVSSYWSAANAAEAILLELDGQIKLDLADRQLCASTLEAVISTDLLTDSLKASLNKLQATRGFVTMDQEHPLRKNTNPVDAMIARYQHRILLSLLPEHTPPHPSAIDFSGPVGDGPVIKRTIPFNANTGPDILVNHGNKTRVSTGLYAKPGTPIEIELSASGLEAGLRAEIGIHSDANWNLTAWHRFPEVSKIVPLTNTKTTAANAFGGLISILIPDNCKAGKIAVTIEGAVKAPVFTLGKTTITEWNTRAKLAPGAWGYIESPKWTGYIPAQILKTIEHSEEIAMYWQKAVDTADLYLGYSQWRKRGESMLTDGIFSLATDTPATQS